MAEDEGADKSQEPTHKREQEYRDKGQVPKSKELMGAFGLLFATIIFFDAAPHIGAGIADLLAYCYQGTGTTDFVRADADQLFDVSMRVIWDVMVPPMLWLWLLTGLVSLIQQQGAYPKEPFKFDPSRFNPVSMVQQRFFSSEPIMELVKALAKLIIIGWLIWRALKDDLGLMLELIMQEPVALLYAFEHYAGLVLARALPVAFIIGVVDITYQWYQIREKMMMSKQEVKDEHKQMEGDPHLKQARRKRAMEIAFARNVRNVPKADVVITNPTHYAVALRYRKEEAPAPVIVARGVDALAIRIKLEATRHDIPQIENRALARALYQGSREGQVIPEDLYAAVAKVLAIVWKRRRPPLRPLGQAAPMRYSPNRS